MRANNDKYTSYMICEMYWPCCEMNMKNAITACCYLFESCCRLSSMTCYSEVAGDRLVVPSGLPQLLALLLSLSLWWSWYLKTMVIILILIDADVVFAAVAAGGNGVAVGGGNCVLVAAFVVIVLFFDLLLLWLLLLLLSSSVVLVLVVISFFKLVEFVVSSWCQWWPAPFAEAVIVTFWAAGRWSLWDRHGILQYLDIRCWTVHVC